MFINNLMFLYTMISSARFEHWLTDRRDDDDGIEQSAGECPLNSILFLAPVPSLFRHLFSETVLEFL